MWTYVRFNKVFNSFCFSFKMESLLDGTCSYKRQDFNDFLIIPDSFSHLFLENSAAFSLQCFPHPLFSSSSVLLRTTAQVICMDKAEVMLCPTSSSSLLSYSKWGAWRRSGKQMLQV